MEQFEKNAIISIKGFQTVAGDITNGCIEFMTDGKYSMTDGVGEISYVESELTGFAGCHTVFHITNEYISLTRAGEVNSEMIFDPIRKHNFVYDTPLGSMLFGLSTQRIINELDENGGRLEIRYSLDVDSRIISNNSFEINVKS